MGLRLNESLDAAPFFKKHTIFLQKAYYLFEKRSDGGIWAVIKPVLETVYTSKNRYRCFKKNIGRFQKNIGRFF